MQKEVFNPVPNATCRLNTKIHGQTTGGQPKRRVWEVILNRSA